MTETIPCPRCVKGTWTDSNGSRWRCAYCGGKGRVPAPAVLRSLPPEFLKKGEMAEVLRVSVPTFDRMRRRGLRMGCPCPENTWGTSILVFRCADVIRWAESLEDRSAA